MLEKTLESPLNCREMKSVNPKENQSWKFIGWTNAEAEAPILGPPDAKNWLLRKDSDAGKDWRQEKGTTEDEMVGWNQWLNLHEFEQAPGVWWWTGKPGMPQSMGMQRIGYNKWLNWIMMVLLQIKPKSWKVEAPFFLLLDSIHIPLLLNSCYFMSDPSWLNRL